MSWSPSIFFTSDKCAGIILITFPLKGYSRTRSMLKGDKDDTKYGSASAHTKAKHAGFFQLRMACVRGRERRLIKS